MEHSEILAVGNMMSDFFKQMITLDTGMIFLIFTLVEKVLGPEKLLKSGFDRALLIITIIPLATSLLLAINALVAIPGRITDFLQGGAQGTFVESFSLNGPIYLFFAGVLLFTVLAIRMLFQPSKT